MKKQILISMAILASLMASPYCVAKSGSSSGAVKLAVAKYQSGNFTGCLQACQDIVSKDPSNALAYYYMAMSYVQAGKKDEAITAYGKVLSLNPNPILSDYATMGKRCIETPDQCNPGGDSGEDAIVNTQFVNGLSDSVRKDIQQKQLNRIKDEINADNYVDKGSKVETNEPIAQKKPTNDEIVAALKVLNAAGLNPYAQTPPITAQGQENYQTSEMAQLQMLLGNNQSNSSNMVNMLPLMMTQNKNGTSNYSSQLMQATLMNSMMSNVNFDLDDDKNK